MEDNPINVRELRALLKAQNQNAFVCVEFKGVYEFLNKDDVINNIVNQERVHGTIFTRKADRPKFPLVWITKK